MLPKSRRISRQQLRKLGSGQFNQSGHFTLKTIKAVEQKFAVSVSKKVAKSAVARNRIRRRAYSAIQKMLKELPNGLYLIVAKAGSEKLKGEELEKELKALFKL